MLNWKALSAISEREILDEGMQSSSSILPPTHNPTSTSTSTLPAFVPLPSHASPVPVPLPVPASTTNRSPSIEIGGGKVRECSSSLTKVPSVSTHFSAVHFMLLSFGLPANSIFDSDSDGVSQKGSKGDMRGEEIWNRGREGPSNEEELPFSIDFLIKLLDKTFDR